ncbi:MAG: MFS transporter [Anaerolineales bacterium]|nr:MFS transporter [Anaerolineales bacterium]GER79808.1 major facilitator superfamily (MSF) transporter [Candidatus Denitrolinea symbiosum]HPP63592.1 MFS transporter [Anaerolineales bacterium]
MSSIYLLIEFLDELVYGVGETAWPLMRDDLHLTYTQIGLLLSLPGIIAAFIEPFIGILGDVWKRRALILAGGVFFTLSLLLASASFSFILLLSAFILFHPSSGAFVSLSQASLMDSDTDRHEQNMARWTLAGTLGVLAGPLLLGLFVYLGLGWRGTYALLASLSTLILLLAFKRIPPDAFPASRPSFGLLLDGFRAALAALKRKEVWRWLLLLEFSDLMLDVLLSYLALYFVDVARVAETQAGVAVAFWLALGLFTDFAFIPFIDRRPDSVKFLRLTAAAQMVFFPLFLLVPGFLPKLVMITFVNFFNTGWYSILQGRLYSALPGQSASLMAIGAVTTPIAKLLPLLIGFLADRFGLQAAMWLLLLGPIALLVGLPKNGQPSTRPAADA